MPTINRPLPGSVPGSCIEVPGRSADDGGFYQFPTQLEGIQGHITLEISATGARRMAQKFQAANLVPAEDLDQLAESLTDALIELEALRRVAAEFEAFKQNLSGVASEGFRIIKKKGPQGKPEEVSV